jgi:hypothetical protein
MGCLFLFDLFSQKPRLKINGEPKVKNMYVAVLGLFVLIGITIISIVLSFDIFNKNTIHVIQNTVSNKFTNITLDTSNQISMFLTNNLGQEIEDYDRIFQIEAKYYTYFPSNNTTSNIRDLKFMTINRTKCEYKRLDGDKEDNIQNVYIKMKSLKCFDLKPYNIHIFGNENPGLPLSSLQFFLNKCTNSTTKTDCLPLTEIDKKLSGVKMSFIFPNKDIDNYLSNPIINFTDGKTFRFASSIMTKYFLELDEINFSLDEGLFFESVNYKKSYIMESISIFQDLRIGGELFPTNFGIVSFKCSGKQKFYKRTYEKIESLFPLFYTIYYFAVLFFKIFVKFLLKGNLEEFLFYKIFDIETFSKIKKLNNKLKYENLFTKNSSLNNDIFDINKINNNNSNILNRNTNNNYNNNQNNIEENNDNYNNNHNNIDDKNDNKKIYPYLDMNFPSRRSNQQIDNNMIENEIITIKPPNKNLLNIGNFKFNNERKKKNILNNNNIDNFNNININFDNSNNINFNNNHDNNSKSQIIKQENNLLRINDEINNIREENKKENDENIDK